MEILKIILIDLVEIAFFGKDVGKSLQKLLLKKIVEMGTTQNQNAIPSVIPRAVARSLLATSWETPTYRPAHRAIRKIFGTCADARILQKRSIAELFAMVIATADMKT